MHGSGDLDLSHPGSVSKARRQKPDGPLGTAAGIQQRDPLAARLQKHHRGLIGGGTPSSSIDSTSPAARGLGKRAVKSPGAPERRTPTGIGSPTGVQGCAVRQRAGLPGRPQERLLDQVPRLLPVRGQPAGPVGTGARGGRRRAPPAVPPSSVFWVASKIALVVSGAFTTGKRASPEKRWARLLLCLFRVPRPVWPEPGTSQGGTPMKDNREALRPYVADMVGGGEAHSGGGRASAQR